MFFKEIGFELKQIKAIIGNSDFDKREALEKHKEILTLKKKRIENLIKLIDYKLAGDTILSFSEFNESSIIAKQKEYHEEVFKRWKNTEAYKEFKIKQCNSNGEFDDINKKVREIFGEITEYMEYPSNCKEVQKLIVTWKNYITENYYNCTNEMLQCLSLMYVEDQRFKSYINSIGDNLAQYINEAINFYCEDESKKL